MGAEGTAFIYPSAKIRAAERIQFFPQIDSTLRVGCYSRTTGRELLNNVLDPSVVVAQFFPPAIFLALRRLLTNERGTRARPVSVRYVSSALKLIVVSLQTVIISFPLLYRTLKILCNIFFLSSVNDQ